MEGHTDEALRSSYYILLPAFAAQISGEPRKNSHNNIIQGLIEDKHALSSYNVAEHPPYLDPSSPEV